MKFYIILGLVLAVAAAVLADDSDWKERLKSVHKECQSNPETHVDESLLEKLRNKEQVDTAPAGKHTRCMATKLGLQNEDGTVNEEKIKKVLGKVIENETELKEAIEHCTKQHESPEKTALKIWGCLAHHAHNVHHHH